MTDRDALMACVLEHPSEDVPRLQYAEWLWDNGEPDRAAFIRDGVAWSRCDPPDFDLLRSLIADLEANYHRWFPDFLSPQWVRKEPGVNLAFKPDYVPGARYDRETNSIIGGEPDDRPCKVERGFITSLTLSWQEWLAHSPKLHWRAGDTMECGDCGGDGWDRNVKVWGCLVCGGTGTKPGTGRIPRPFVPTTQPILAVHLTEDPPRDPDLGLFQWKQQCGGSVQLSKPGEPRSFTCEKWRGITFFLPPR